MFLVKLKLDEEGAVQSVTICENRNATAAPNKEVSAEAMVAGQEPIVQGQALSEEKGEITKNQGNA